jgi:hypothetical protein
MLTGKKTASPNPPLEAGDVNTGKLKWVLTHFYQHVTRAARGKQL